MQTKLRVTQIDCEATSIGQTVFVYKPAPTSFDIVHAQTPDISATGIDEKQLFNSFSSMFQTWASDEGSTINPLLFCAIFGQIMETCGPHLYSIIKAQVGFQ